MGGFTKIPKLQVEDLGTENTGDRIALFNSDGEVVGYMLSDSLGGDFIPLSGTEVDKPITGDIEIGGGYSSVSLVKTHEDENKIMKISFEESGLNFSVQNIIGGHQVGMSLDVSGIFIGTTDISSKGLYSSIYYGANYNGNTYVQKKYVDDAIATTDATATPLSLSDLNTAYPTQGTGFKVICPAIGITYMKSSLTTWEEIRTSTVV